MFGMPCLGFWAHLEFARRCSNAPSCVINLRFQLNWCEFTGFCDYMIEIESSGESALSVARLQLHSVGANNGNNQSSTRPDPHKQTHTASI